MLTHPFMQLDLICFMFLTANNISRAMIMMLKVSVSSYEESSVDKYCTHAVMILLRSSDQSQKSTGLRNQYKNENDKSQFHCQWDSSNKSICCILLSIHCIPNHWKRHFISYSFSLIFKFSWSAVKATLNQLPPSMFSQKIHQSCTPSMFEAIHFQQCPLSGSW